MRGARLIRHGLMVVGFGLIVLEAPGAAAESFFDVYGGASITADSDVTIRNGVTFDDKVKFDTEGMGGGRVGHWFDGIRWLGVAGDFSYFAPAGQGTAVETRLEVIPMTPLLMLRLMLLDSPEFPNGRLQPYIAGGPGFFLTSVKVDGPGVERRTDWQFEVGVDARAGLAFMITPNVGTFAEARYTAFSVNPGGQSTEFDIETVHFVGGLSFRW